MLMLKEDRLSKLIEDHHHRQRFLEKEFVLPDSFPYMRMEPSRMVENGAGEGGHDLAFKYQKVILEYE